MRALMAMDCRRRSPVAGAAGEPRPAGHAVSALERFSSSAFMKPSVSSHA
jgi:hypothetical protein